MVTDTERFILLVVVNTACHCRVNLLCQQFKSESYAIIVQLRRLQLLHYSGVDDGALMMNFARGNLTSDSRH